MNQSEYFSVSAPRTSVAQRTGVAISAVVALALCADATAQLLVAPAIVDAAKGIGYSTSAALWRGIGAVLLASTVLYVLPRTAFIGALLLTGFLGGAIASHVRVGEGAVGPVIVSLALATLVWAGLGLRDERLRAVLRSR
jgi:hypothetical protein